MKRKATAAILAQGVQAGVSFALQILVLRVLGVDQYGRFAVLYGVAVLAMAVVSGLVGDSLVVLHRECARVRAGLELVALVLILTITATAVGIALVTRFVDAAEAVSFAFAMVSFMTMEIVRRLMVAHLMFMRVMVADILGFAVSLTGIAVGVAAGHATLATFLAAVALGQAVGFTLGWRLLPNAERVLVPIRTPDVVAVWKYGAWRSLQQMLRPGLYTAVRILVAQFSGLAAVGMLEATRTYVSPLILVVGGFSSLLFVRFADSVKSGHGASLKEADRVVMVLVLLSGGLSVIALSLRSWAGPVIFEVHLNPVAVLAWITYGLSVAMVTPYGAICAVSGRQGAVFAVRFLDTLLSILATVIVLATGASFTVVPFVLGGLSLLGGVALRVLASRDAQVAPLEG